MESSALLSKGIVKDKCTIYGFKWHPPEKCWEKVGYPSWHSKYKGPQQSRQSRLGQSQDEYWTSHSEDEQDNYAFMACNSSGSDTEEYPHRTLKHKGIVNSGCSRHMIRNKASCKAKSVSSISNSLQLLHMDLFGPTSPEWNHVGGPSSSDKSLSGNQEKGNPLKQSGYEQKESDDCKMWEYKNWYENSEQAGTKIKDWEIEEERKRLAEEEATKTALSDEYDFIQARIEADILLTSKTYEMKRERAIRIGMLRSNKAYQKDKEEEDTVQVTAKRIEVNEQVQRRGKGVLIKMICKEKPRKQSDVYKECHTPDGDYLVIYRAKGNFRAFNYLMEVLHIFDRKDLFHLYELIMEQYSEIILEGFELDFFGEMKIIEWNPQQSENDRANCILELKDRNSPRNMYVERRYPLSKINEECDALFNGLDRRFECLELTTTQQMGHQNADAPPPPLPQSQTPVVAQAPHTMPTIKLPILKKGEYDVWAMKMKHYLAHTDYPLWEVIQKGNGPVNVSTDTQGIMKVLSPKTAKETLARERERKARTTLLLALPEDNLAKFHKMTDAKEMWEAIKSRFGGNEESKKNKANDNSKRLGKKEESNALMTLDEGCVDWTSHSEDKEDNYAFMAYNSSAQLSDASIEIQAYTQALKKVEAQLVAHQQSQLWLGYGDYRYDGILSYENEVLQSVFMNKKSDLENQPLYDRFVTAEGMHAVPPPMTGNYMPFGPDIEIDYSQFTYGPKQTQTSESEIQTSDFDTCESDCSVETHESLPEPAINEPKVVNQTKVWSGAPIIEEYESDSEDEHVSLPTEKQETPISAVGGKGKLLLSPQQIVIGDQTDITGKISPNTIVDQDYPHKTLQNKWIVDSGCSRHMTGNKAYLAEYQDFNGGLVTFGGSKGYITGKGKIKTGKLDFEDVCFVKEL
ncbi:hypothetical protein Tco_1430660 [Tanacetum coccineum]